MANSFHPIDRNNAVVVRLESMAILPRTRCRGRGLGYALDASSMHLYKLTYQRQPDPQAALVAVEGSVYLREEFEDLRQLFHRDADSRISHAHDHLAILLLGRERHAASSFRELRGVVQEVGKHLRETDSIGMENDRDVRKCDTKSEARLFDERPGDVEGNVDHALQGDVIPLQAELASGDSRNVQ